MNCKSIFRVTLITTSCAVVAACTSVPLPAPMSQAPCVACSPAPEYSYAVTRPLSCNDYPVSYRVQTPETDSRVRNIERSVLMAQGQTQYVYQQAPCVGK